MDRVRPWKIFLFIYAAIVAAHAWLLRLPYFWDEAGYYIPAAHDFFAYGKVIPSSTLTNAHPPLLSIYLATWWKLLGYSPLVTRLAMLAVAAFALLQFFLLARRVANREVAFAATLCTAVYPVFFAQSSLAHADLPAMALTMLGLRLFLEDKWSRCALAFTFAALAKETAILAPMILFAWTFFWGWLLARTGFDVHITTYDAAGKSEFHPLNRSGPRLSCTLWLLVPLLPLAAWYCYHYARTGYIFGNPEFVRYNVAMTLSPLRFLLALWQRIWQVIGHMNMWVLTTARGAAMLLPPLASQTVAARRRHDSGQDAGGTKPRIAIPLQILFAALIAAHIMAYSLIGGALLSRYLLAVIPLVILIGVSTLWRRVKEWKWVLGFVCLAFVIGWFVNPPYRFAPEDNLNYADYVRLHRHAIDFLGHRFAQTQVLTAWPATDELRKPELGYVNKPSVSVIAIENFSVEQIMLAQHSSDYDAVLAFSMKYEPPQTLFHWTWWEKQNVRFFDYHRDLPPEVIARMLGGTVVMQENRNGQWVAVIEIERARNAGSKANALPFDSRSTLSVTDFSYSCASFFALRKMSANIFSLRRPVLVFCMEG